MDLKTYRPAPPELQQRVRLLIEQKGMRGASRDLGLADATTARVAGGCPVNPATIVVADTRAPKAAE